MRRELDQVRALLLAAEKQSPLHTKDPGSGQYAMWLGEAGYVQASDGSSVRQAVWMIHRLTTRGADFLSTIRSDAQWAAVKARLGADDAPLPLVERVAFDLAAAQAGYVVAGAEEAPAVVT